MFYLREQIWIMFVNEHVLLMTAAGSENLMF